jgi:hypothetical protein
VLDPEQVFCREVFKVLCPMSVNDVAEAASPCAIVVPEKFRTEIWTAMAAWEET